jgi:2-polyprenyl-3-methyl-5-hydroxy-6-metoxy-1,4-benzoquinol methylase
LHACATTDSDGYVTLQTAPYRTHHLLATAALALTRPGDRVFEGGVSSGYFAGVLVRAGRRVDGHELDPAAAQRARDVCETVVVGDLQTFDPAALEPGYRLVLFGDTLEHIADPVPVLRGLRRKLTDDGHLVVSVPNVANWAVRLGLLVGRFEYRDRGILDRTHLRFYTRRSLAHMLEDAGFRVDRISGAIPVPLVRGERVARAVHRIGNVRPSLFAYQFVVTASPAR